MAHALLDAYSDGLDFDPSEAQAYFAVHNEFTRLLAVLIELSSGLPATGTEFAQLQHTNRLLGARNLLCTMAAYLPLCPATEALVGRRSSSASCRMALVAWWCYTLLRWCRLCTCSTMRLSSHKKQVQCCWSTMLASLGKQPPSAQRSRVSASQWSSSAHMAAAGCQHRPQADPTNESTVHRRRGPHP